MNKKQIIEHFGFDRSTLNNWEKTDSKRHLLFLTLTALPNSFVKTVISQNEEMKETEKRLVQLLTDD